mmetsp:Transcript_17157/g.66799  ORF Transcript_17157/g.66799 Transcript_17157/m.66799 type:complete len:259 (+) Transcript_17157:114-890(+)
MEGGGALDAGPLGCTRGCCSGGRRGAAPRNREGRGFRKDDSEANAALRRSIGSAVAHRGRGGAGRGRALPHDAGDPHGRRRPPPPRLRRSPDALGGGLPLAPRPPRHTRAVPAEPVDGRVAGGHVERAAPRLPRQSLCPPEGAQALYALRALGRRPPPYARPSPHCTPERSHQLRGRRHSRRRRRRRQRQCLPQALCRGAPRPRRGPAPRRRGPRRCPTEKQSGRQGSGGGGGGDQGPGEGEGGGGGRAGAVAGQGAV